MSSQEKAAFSRSTKVSELGTVMHRVLRPGIVVIAIATALMCLRLFLKDESGWLGLLLMGTGACVALAIWRSHGIGLPLLPLMAVQHFAVYGIPIFSRNETIITYPDEMITQCGVQIAVFLVTMSMAWRGGMHLFVPKRGAAYTFKIFNTGGSKTLRMVAMGLVITTTSHEVLHSAGILDMFYSLLPEGSYSIISAALNAAGMSGFFLSAMCIGSGEVSNAFRLTVWSAFIVICVIMAASFLLSSTTNLVGAVTIGLFWGAGRMPWRFLAITVTILSFLHIGKFEMRERYWQKGDDYGAQSVALSDIPAHYLEWFDSSYGILTGKDNAPQGVFLSQISQSREEEKGQSMLNRVNNLQNLLFAMDAVDQKRIPTLGGQTYSLIPPLLIPRVLWPEKPRTHEGQVLLNTHFGRQTLRDSFTTYIAWGLIPEAYGNFGAYLGVIILGTVCGFIFAWIETATAHKPLLSLEGLVSFALFIGLAISFEMVASVLVTSLFQSIITIMVACIPFVHQSFPDEEEEVMEEAPV